MMSDIKKIGVVNDLDISLRGVFIIKHEQPLGFFSIYLSSCCNAGLVIKSIRSTGLLSVKSLTSLDAPLISNDLTGLVLLRVSTLFTAKWRGVYPSIS